MSDYVKEKVLRIPVSKEQEKCILEKHQVEDLWELEDKVTNFEYAQINHFQIAPTERKFIDYVLFYSYGSCCGEFGKVRELTDTEKGKYGQLFKDIYDGFNIDDIRLVEFCWYNCSEAPDYYDLKNDDFYEEV